MDNVPSERKRFPPLHAIEIAAAFVILLAMIAQGLFLYRLVPPLVFMCAQIGLTLSLPLRTYIGLSNQALIAVPALLLLWGGFHWSGRPLAPKIRCWVLVTTAGLAVSVTVFGLYFIAEDSLLQAMRLSFFAGASAPILERDLGAQYLASGEPGQVIALIDPKGTRDDFASHPRWSSPGQAFQLAEAYRAQGNVEAARRLYRISQEAAVAFDKALTQELFARQIRWQSQYGVDLEMWMPDKTGVRKLPELIRTVAQQRLDQLPPAAPR
jgi:hypothetical protein